MIKTTNEPLTPTKVLEFSPQPESSDIPEIMEPTKLESSSLTPPTEQLGETTPNSELDEIFGATSDSLSRNDMKFFDPCSAESVRSPRHLSQEEKTEQLAASNLWLLSTMGQLNMQSGTDANPSLTASSRSESPCGSSDYSVSPVTSGVRYHSASKSHGEISSLQEDLSTELPTESKQPPQPGVVPKVTVEDCNLQKKSYSDGNHDIRLSDKLATDLASKGIKQRLAEFLPKFSFSGRSTNVPSRGGTNGSFRGNQMAVESANLKQVKSEASLAAYEAKHRPMLSSIHSISGSNSRLNSPLKSSPIISSELKLGHTDDYLYQAAQFISSAQKSEAEGYYDLAFSCYKAGVNLLISGVQGEKDVNKRNAVRQKTAKYLVKAERIYHNYLACDNGDMSKGDLWNVSESISITSALICNKLVLD